MNIEARKISLVHQLLLVQQDSILDKIEALLVRRTSTITEARKKAIDKGLQSLSEGKKIPHNEMMKHMKEKYPKYFK